MKNNLICFFVLFLLVNFMSCNPVSFTEFVVKNDLEQNVEVLFYIADSIDEKISIPQKQREAIMSESYTGKIDLYLDDNDSIHIILEDGGIIKYTNSNTERNIYDTENRNVWVEEYNKRTKYNGGEYRYVFTIDESIEGE